MGGYWIWISAWKKTPAQSRLFPLSATTTRWPLPPCQAPQCNSRQPAASQDQPHKHNANLCNIHQSISHNSTVVQALVNSWLLLYKSSLAGLPACLLCRSTPANHREGCNPEHRKCKTVKTIMSKLARQKQTNNTKWGRKWEIKWHQQADIQRRCTAYDKKWRRSPKSEAN